MRLTHKNRNLASKIFIKMARQEAKSYAIRTAYEQNQYMMFRQPTSDNFLQFDDFSEEESDSDYDKMSFLDSEDYGDDIYFDWEI